MKRIGIIANLGMIGMTLNETAALVEIINAVCGDGVQLMAGTQIACLTKQGFQTLVAILQGRPKEHPEGGMTMNRVPDYMFDKEQALLYTDRAKGESGRIPPDPTAYAVLTPQKTALRQFFCFFTICVTQVLHNRQK